MQMSHQQGRKNVSHHILTQKISLKLKSRESCVDQNILKTITKWKECDRWRRHPLLHSQWTKARLERTRNTKQTNFWWKMHTRTYLSWHQRVNTDSLKLLFTRLTQMEMVEAQGQVSESQSAKEEEEKNKRQLSIINQNMINKLQQGHVLDKTGYSASLNTTMSNLALGRRHHMTLWVLLLNVFPGLWLHL